MTEINIYNNNVVDFLNQYTGPKFSFALYDPPYEMSIIENKWDKSGVVFSKEYNEGLFNAMKPGAFVLCYGHPRIFHRMMTSLEDAGFIISKTIFAWGYSSGSPQGASNLQRNIDKFFAKQYGGLCECENPKPVTVNGAGSIRPDFKNIALPVDVCDICHKPVRKILEIKKWSSKTGKKKMGGPGYGNNNEQIIAASLTIESELLKAYSYGSAALKPVVEPIVLVQKPFEDNNAVESIIKHGAGIINVHETRYIDRWPGNFVAIHDLGCECVDGEWLCVSGCEIGEEMKRDPAFAERYPMFSYNEIDLSLSQIDPMVMQAKPGTKEKEDNPHITIKPVKLNQYLGKLFLPPPEFGTPNAFVPYCGSGSEIMGLIAAGWEEVTGVELDEKFAKYSVERISSHVKNAKINYV